jgi:hypothetical protein
MNGITIHGDTASPVLAALAKYDAESRTFVNGYIGRAMQNEVRDYLRNIAQTRHATAESLGATPTGFWGFASENVGRPDALSIDADGVTVTVMSPGIGRADHDVDIFPGPGKQWLTIPANAAAYGNRFLVGTAERARFKDGVMLPPKNPDAPLYVFTKEVHQKQDRSLLPSDAELKAAAREGAADGIDALIRRAQRDQRSLSA